MPIFFDDPFKKRLIVRPSDSQLEDMISAGIEDYTIDQVNNTTTLRIADSFWNRRKLKKLKIKFTK